MNVVKAAIESMELANPASMGAEGEVGYDHCNWMTNEMILHKNDWSYGKLCRWLGWIQASIVGSGCATLEQMKQINKANIDDGPSITAGQIVPPNTGGGSGVG